MGQTIAYEQLKGELAQKLFGFRVKYMNHLGHFSDTYAYGYYAIFMGDMGNWYECLDYPGADSEELRQILCFQGFFLFLKFDPLRTGRKWTVLVWKDGKEARGDATTMERALGLAALNYLNGEFLSWSGSDVLMQQ